MDILVAGDFLAGAARQQVMPLWVIVLIGVTAASVAGHFVKVRSEKAWRRWIYSGLVAGAAGGIAMAIVWCVGYFFFNVDLTE